MIDFATWRWPSMRIGEQEKGEYKPSEGMIGKKKFNWRRRKKFNFTPKFSICDSSKSFLLFSLVSCLNTVTQIMFSPAQKACGATYMVKLQSWNLFINFLGICGCSEGYGPFLCVLVLIFFTAYSHFFVTFQEICHVFSTHLHLPFPLTLWAKLYWVGMNDAVYS